MSKASYTNASDEKLKLILRQAEERLAAQLQVALAADQRAMTFASILLAAAAVLIAWDGTDTLWWPKLILIAAFTVAGGFSLWAASPIGWELVGNTPEAWVEDIAEGNAGDDAKHSANAAMAAHYAKMIGDNEMSLTGNANWFRTAKAISFVGVLLAAVIAGLSA